MSNDRALVTALLGALAHGPIEVRHTPTLGVVGTAADFCPAERTLYVDPSAPTNDQADAVLRALSRARRRGMCLAPGGA